MSRMDLATYIWNDLATYIRMTWQFIPEWVATYTWMSWQLNLQTKKIQFIDSLRKPNNIKWRDKVNNVHARVITPGACSPRCTRDVRIWQFSDMTYNSLKGSTSLEFKDLSCYTSIFINFHFLCTVFLSWLQPIYSQDNAILGWKHVAEAQRTWWSEA